MMMHTNAGGCKQKWQSSGKGRSSGALAVAAPIIHRPIRRRRLLATTCCQATTGASRSRSPTEWGASHGGRGEIKIDVHGLATVYSGHLSPRGFQTDGYVDGPIEALNAAAAIFSGPQPWMPDMF